jgi:hypothetical protein
MLSRLVASAIALSLALSFAPLVHAEEAEGSTGHGSHRLHYPMKSEDFKKVIEKRIAGVKNAIDKKLERHGVSPDRRAQIRHTVDVAATDLRAAVEKVGSDGVVTKEESVKVKSLADKLRGKVRKQLREEKNAQKKGAGDKPPRDKKADEEKRTEQRSPAPAQAEE